MTVGIAVRSLVVLALSPIGLVSAVRVDEEDAMASEMASSVQSSILTRLPESLAFPAAPCGTSQNLFVPAMHTCNETAKEAFLKRNPGQRVETQKQKKIRAALVVVHDVLRSLGLPTILEAGSLLGFYRQCDIIPTDNDADVSLMGHWLQGDASLENMGKAFKAQNGTLHTEMCPHGPTTTGCETRVWFEDDDTDRIYVDLFIWATYKKCEKAPCTFFDSLWPTGKLGPYFNPCLTNPIAFEQASFLNRTFWIPTPTLPYLERQYGKGWTDPGGGGYMSCIFDKHLHPVPDKFGKAIPPASYVLSLEPTASPDLGDANEIVRDMLREMALEDPDLRDIEKIATLH